MQIYIFCCLFKGIGHPKNVQKSTNLDALGLYYEVPVLGKKKREIFFFFFLR